MATDQHGISFFLQTSSGNESDKKTLLTIITQLTESLQHPGKVYHIADAAFYAADLPLQPCADGRYQYAEHASEYASILQKWVIYPRHRCRSSRRRHSQNGWRKTERKQKCHSETSGHGEFACEPDARIAAAKWLQENPQSHFRSLGIRTTTRKLTKKRGRPKADEPVETAYTVFAELEYGPLVVEQRR
jgi:transposase